MFMEEDNIAKLSNLYAAYCVLINLCAKKILPFFYERCLIDAESGIFLIVEDNVCLKDSVSFLQTYVWLCVWSYFLGQSLMVF